uniref:Uncharacterized protein n=1 Tax=Anguilla anguilla TaxID=7936 RepID=A0A0E9V4F3_ANGAN
MKGLHWGCGASSSVNPINPLWILLEIEKK